MCASKAYEAVVQCVTDLRDVWQRHASWAVVDLAVASLRDDAQVAVQQAKVGAADPLILRADAHIDTFLRIYASGGKSSELASAFASLWVIAKEMKVNLATLSDA